MLMRSITPGDCCWRSEAPLKCIHLSRVLNHVLKGNGFDLNAPRCIQFSEKGVYQAQSCLGCAEAAFAVYKNNICRLPPWLFDAVKRPKSEPRPDPLRFNTRVLSECVARAEPVFGFGGALVLALLQ